MKTSVSRSTNCPSSRKDGKKPRPGTHRGKSVPGRPLLEDESMNGEQGDNTSDGSQALKGIIVMVKMPKGDDMDLVRMDACRDAMRQVMASESDECKDKVWELSQLLNKTIPEGHSNLEVVMALDALQYSIIKDMMAQGVNLTGGIA